jgi:peptidyl-prolyl cis-trans isomerase C
MKLYTAFALSLLAAVVGCSQNKTAATESAAKPVATVNGAPLARDTYDYFVKSVSGKTATELTAEQRDQVLDDLVRAEVVAQQAIKDGLDKKGDAPALMALSKMQMLQQAASEAYLKDRKPTDAEIKAEYDTQVAAMPKTQYKAHHILVHTEAEAQTAIDRITKKHEKFEVVAKEMSLDSSGKNGGDLGDFFAPGSMVKPFADAVASLKKGEITAKPVQTEYGFHVIRLDDTRETTAPPFDAVKDRVEQILKQKKFKAYVDDLMKTAKVEKTL